MSSCKLSLARRPWVAAITASGSKPNSSALAVHAASTAAIESVSVPSWYELLSSTDRLLSYHVEEDSVSSECSGVGV